MTTSFYTAAARRLTALVIACGALASTPAGAQGGSIVFGGDGFSIRLTFGADADPAPIREDLGWRRLGQIELSDVEERNVLRLPDERRFDQIQLCVGRRAAEIDRFRIVFDNGARQDVDVRPVIGAGECTRAINLDGRNSRDIRRIVIRGSSARPAGPQPILTLRGRLVDDGGTGGGGGGGRAAIAEFVLPDDTARLFADVDAGRRFDEVRLCVDRRAAALERVRIIFGNGGEQLFRLNRLIGAGDCTPWVDLNGRASRSIDSIVLIGETEPDRGRQAVVRILAR